VTITSHFGANTKGGEGEEFSRVVYAGGFAEAIAAKGPRRVYVAGQIDLKGQKVSATNPHLTVVGLPGSRIINGGLSIRTNDVIVQNLRVHRGCRVPAGDGISIWGGGAYNVLVQYCSVFHATDENVSVSGDDDVWAMPSNVTFRDCIIAEGLRNANHQDGPHSHGALIRGTMVAIERCLFVSNYRRNPEYRDGATGLIANNVILGPGTAAIYLDDTEVSVLGNLLVPAVWTRVPSFLSGSGLAYSEGNLTVTDDSLELEHGSAHLVSAPYLREGHPRIRPALSMAGYVLRNAGAFPRDSHDRRALRGLRRIPAGIIDSPEDVEFDSATKP